MFTNLTQDPPCAGPLASTIEIACRRLCIGRTLLYEQVKLGRLRTVKIGTRTLIAEIELQRFMGNLTQGLDPKDAGAEVAPVFARQRSAQDFAYPKRLPLAQDGAEDEQ